MANASVISVCSGCPQRDIDLTLIALGGTGCGIEVTNGVAYSIGTQLISYTGGDQCISLVRINGMEPPALVGDGQPISISVTVVSNCCLVSVTGPSCIPIVQQQSFAFGIRMIDGKPMLILRKPSRFRRRRRTPPGETTQ